MSKPDGPPIDVSVPIRPRMPIYAGNPGVAIELARSIERGDEVNVSRLELGAHTGTHVDAPRHVIAEASGADELALDRYIGPCVVVDAAAATGPIDAALIDSLDLPRGSDRVLLKTRNSGLWGRDAFTADFVRLNASSAQALIEREVRLVGIDYLSVGDLDADVVLLAGGIGVIEGLDLRDVDPGAYFLIAPPVKIARCDGAPARAVLLRQQG